MPKFRIAETLRVELIIDSDNANNAVKEYMKDFLLLFNSERKIDCKEGSDFTVHYVNENGSLGHEVDPAESDSQD